MIQPSDPVTLVQDSKGRKNASPKASARTYEVRSRRRRTSRASPATASGASHQRSTGGNDA